MPVETAAFISDLNAANPPGSDGMVQGDDHLRLLKATLKATFPNITGAMTATHGALNALGSGNVSLTDGALGTPSLFFASDTTTGFYKAAAGRVGIAGRLQGNGASRTGEKVEFIVDPGTAVMARGGVATGAEDCIELDGAIYPIGTFPTLGALLGSTYGGNGTTTFAVPNLQNGARYCRSRTSGLAVGTTQGSCILTHTHTYHENTSSTGAHNHGGNTGVNSVDHTHSDNIASTRNLYVPSGYGADARGNLWADSPTASINTGGQSQQHTHSISTDGGHFHTFSGTTDPSGVSETRPETFVVIMAVKT